MPIQTALAGSDAINEYLVPVGRGIFACPPGVVSDDGWWGQTLLG